MTLKEPYKTRLNLLRKGMADLNLSALLVSRPENRRYLSGYSATDPQLDESSGFLMITSRQQLVLTDFRYDIQARKEAAGYKIVVYKNGLAPSVGALLKRFKVARLGFESDHMIYRNYELLKGQTDAYLQPVTGLVEKLRVRKDATELKAITRSLRITEKAFQLTLEQLKPGLTEVEAARFLDESMLRLGADEPAFDTIVASGPNAALPHAVPTIRKIREGEPIVIDCGARRNGYGSDMTRTVVLGTPPAWLKTIYLIVRQAQLSAIAALKPGLTTSEADATARRHIEDQGYGPYFGHSLGHGVGLATHEAPALSQLRSTVLEQGMVVTVEPGIYLEGRGGVRLEEMVTITDEKAKVINKDRHFYNWLD